MKIVTIKETFEESSGVVSDLVRKLAFAGIGIIWILRISGEHGEAVRFPTALIRPLLLLVTTLGADLLQYVSKAAVNWALNFYFWRKYRDNNKDVHYSGWWNAIWNTFFVIKTALIAVAYWKLLTFLSSEVMA